MSAVSYSSRLRHVIVWLVAISRSLGVRSHGVVRCSHCSVFAVAAALPYKVGQDAAEPVGYTLIILAHRHGKYLTSVMSC